MTDKEKARAYDEALEDMRVIYPNLRGDAKLAVEHVFPELAESEDERMKRIIMKFVWGYTNTPHSIINGDKSTCEYAKEVEAYLEKQKEQKPSQTNTEKEYVRTLKSLISDFLHGKQEIDTEYYRQIYDWLDGRHIEQKVLPGFDGLTPEEKPSEDIEQAAEDSWVLYEYRETPQGLYSSCYQDGFIAGAEWKEEQMPMPEDTVLFQKGVEEGRRLEKDDLALTWEDMATIDSLLAEVSNSYAVGNFDYDGERENFYNEVLKRFKETKE